MSRFALGVGAVVVLGLGVLGLTSVRVAERGRFALDYSTYGAGPDGTMALFTLLEREGRAPRRWSEDLGRLPAGGMLVLTGGCDALSARPLSRAERENLRSWITAGGVLLVAGAGGIVDDTMGLEMRARSASLCEPEPSILGWARTLNEDEAPDEVLPAPTVPVDAPPADTKPEDYVPSEEELGEMIAELDAELEEPEWASALGPPLTGMPPVSFRRAGTIDILAWDRTRALLVADGKNLGVVSSMGEGFVVALASASMFQNRDLAEGSGAALFLRLSDHYAPGGPIWFDEYHVGAGERRSMMRYFGQLGIVPALMQGLFALGLVLVARGRRFGGVREATREPTSATAAFVHALAGLFRGSKDRAGAIELLKKDAYVRIARFHHSKERDPDALARALDDRGRSGAASAVRAITKVASSTREAMVPAAAAEIDAALTRALAKSPEPKAPRPLASPKSAPPETTPPETKQPKTKQPKTTQPT